MGIIRQLRYIFNELWNFGKPEIEALEKQTLELKTQLEQLKEIKRFREELTRDATQRVLRGALEAMRAVQSRQELKEAKMREVFSNLEKELGDEVLEKVAKGSMEDIEAIIQSALDAGATSRASDSNSPNSMKESSKAPSGS